MEHGGRRLSLWMFYLSAVYFGILGLIILWLSDGNGAAWSALLAVGNPWQVLGLGTVLALVVVGMEVAVATFLPDRFWVDDGTNAFFSQLSYLHIVLLMAVTALSEEIFFRAAIQSLLLRWLASVAAGLAIAAAVFAVAHVRYLTKPVLLAGAWVIGLLMGWGYWFTGSIWTSVWAHFLFNFIMTVLGKQGWFLPRREPQASG